MLELPINKIQSSIHASSLSFDSKNFISFSHLSDFNGYFFNGELDKPNNAVIIDQFHMVKGGTKVEDIENFYFNVIRNLKPGLSQIIIHLGKDEPELKKITVDHPNFDYRWRQKDHDIMNSKEFKNLLKENDIKLISWHDLKKAIL